MSRIDGIDHPGPGRRRKTKNPKVENYYKILGVRANAKAESIKKSYIQLVKQFPPEQHPEQFQQIRRAYETVGNPVKRKEYDFQRKYGGSVTKLLDEAYEWLERESLGKAETLFKKALELVPGTVSAHLGLAQIMLRQENLEQFQEQIRLLINNAKTEEDKERSYALAARLLYDFGYLDEALEWLHAMMEQYPDSSNAYAPLLTFIYQDLGRGEEAYTLIESSIPSEEEQQPEQFELFLNWIHVMIRVGKWQCWSRVQPRVRKFLKSIHDEDDRTIIREALLGACNDYMNTMDFRSAQLFTDLACYLDRRNEEASAAKKKIELYSKLNTELQRLPMDTNIPPDVSFQAARWFYSEFPGMEGLVHALLEMPNMFPETGDAEYIAGIRKLSTKYPLLYKHYQEQWNALCDEKSSTRRLKVL
ncbi:J domain-containing protein [Paenibacillus medicaginis]|uniref:DnaJ domain-containing protein n=1 Tax=Paenibacillus medicaginis TaxID=1470560 RepID=A0ABV5BYK9_9BACL